MFKKRQFKKMKKYSIFVLILTVFLFSCQQKDNRLKNGNWHAHFTFQQQTVPFQFEVDSATNQSAIVYLINGKERVKLNNITYSGDSVTIPIESYDSKLTGTITNGQFNGLFIKNYTEGDQGVPFTAEFSDNPRFALPEHPTAISPAGKWDVQFISEKGDTAKNVGIFNLNDGIVTGSVLTSFGDLRFLDGALTADGFQLSAFSGQNPYYLNLKFQGDSAFSGNFYTVRGITQVRGERNNSASLADPYSFTNMKEGQSSLNFTFPDINGKPVSLNDSRYKDKVVILSILGSWCPNCLDEMAFLAPWYKENKDRGIEIIGLSFERKDDPEYVKKVLTQLVNTYGVEYEILFAGKIGDNVLPEIDGIKSFPTTIFIDKKGNVRKIHTGFSGPATGLFYEEFKQDFNKLVDDLLNEK